MQSKHEESEEQSSPETSVYTTSLQRLLQRNEQIASTQSLGEAIVPYLLALVEACWFNAILIGLAGVDFLQTNTVLVPFWGPPVLLCATLWLFQRVLRKEASSSEKADKQEGDTSASRGFTLLFGVLALLDIGLIWLHSYAGTNFLLDPRWLLSFAGDLLSLNAHFYQALAIVAMTVYFCWRGSKLAQMTIEPSHVRRQLWIGLICLFLAILLRAGGGRTSGNFDDIVLVLLLPAFLYFVLSAHALARTSFVRRSHPFGLEGNVASQERAILSVIGGVGLILLLITLLSALFSATFFDALQPTWHVLSTIYNWFVGGLSLLLAWISIPIFGFLTWLASLAPHHTAPPPLPGMNSGKVAPLPPISQTSPGIILTAKILFPLLIILALVFVLYLIVRRRKRLRLTRNHASGDTHVSVWSWELFWRQFKAFLAALFGRNGRQADAIGDIQNREDLPAEPTARTMREIYRALLKRAASIGYVRRRNETPREFQQRLNQLHPSSNEPQLGLITEAYTLTRYGGNVPSEFDLATTRRSWDELEQKWVAPL